MDEPRTIHELDQRREERQALWGGIEAAAEATEKARVVRANRTITRASGADAEAKADDFIVSAEGTRKIKLEMKVLYGAELLEKFSNGNRLERAVAPLFEPELEGQLTAAGKAMTAVASHATLAPVREQARQQIIEVYKDEEEVRAHTQVKKDEAEILDNQATLRDEMVAQHGTKATKWEALYDEESGAPFWYNCGDGLELWQMPAICENCDEIIDDMDVLCFECNTDRSLKNQALYKGASKKYHKVEEEDEYDAPEGDQQGPPGTAESKGAAGADGPEGGAGGGDGAL